MDCGPVRELLPLYAGGEVEEEDRGAVQAHLALCDSCAQELDRYREDRAALAALHSEEEAVPDVWRAIEGALRPARRPLAGMVARCAAALLVGLLVGLAVAPSGRPVPPASESVVHADRPVPPGVRAVEASGVREPRIGPGRAPRELDPRARGLEH